MVDHMLTRFNMELGNQQKQIKKLQVRSMHMRSADQNIQFSQASDSASALQAQNAELQFYDKLHADRPDQQA